MALLVLLEVLGAELLAPARAVASHHRGIEPQAGHDHEGVARVREYRDPVALPVLLPMHEAARVKRMAQQPAAMERVAHRAGAVVATVLERTVPAAVDVRLFPDVVRGRDDLLDAAWSAVGRL